MHEMLPGETIIDRAVYGGAASATCYCIPTVFSDRRRLLWAIFCPASTSPPSGKMYVAVFICLCTKAVHLELVSDLTTDRFIQALRRFSARRGKCEDLYSDNGTNFVGARNKLKELDELLRTKEHREGVARHCSEQGTRWHFNPPSAPHFGGLWEAAVRSAKIHLVKVVGETPLSPEDFTTLLVQIEGCLNSRPLTPMSDDPNDLEPLTPSHFLIGSSLQSLPDPDLENVKLNRLDRFQLMQKLLQDFWKRWRREYLCQLQGRNKRWKPPIKVDIGGLVIIREDNQPPMKWKLGRITAVHPGTDGIQLLWQSVAEESKDVAILVDPYCIPADNETWAADRSKSAAICTTEDTRSRKC
ncbi:uncharacterized protein LOC134221972 [Armigeres subalbatus]|uniref:uncharacterized protein LOC134221972 n=1 Tax=Armigeres subalbatus TaxID=124917 RepID=UPI002ED6B7E4